uniref:Uncharacterized protein n=1 Tax=Rhizophora mucronata TaxID=61149 RepID=A0A2P2LS22_RHIMU
MIEGKTLSITRASVNHVSVKRPKKSASLLLNKLREWDLNCRAPNMGKMDHSFQNSSISRSNHLQNKRLNSNLKSILHTQPKLNGSLFRKLHLPGARQGITQQVTSHGKHQVHIDRPPTEPSQLAASKQNPARN